MVQAWFALTLLIVIVGCGGAKSSNDDEATVTVAEGAVVPDPEGTPVDTVAPYEGVWDVGTVRGHLARAGVITTEAGEIRQPFLGGRGTRLRGEMGELQVFVYADAGARARDTDRLDSNALVLPGETGAEQRPAALVTADNVAVIVVGRDSALLQSVASVLRARRD